MVKPLIRQGVNEIGKNMTDNTQVQTYNSLE